MVAYREARRPTDMQRGLNVAETNSPGSRRCGMWRSNAR